MKQKVALVLSGGGARGIAHIGVIEVLQKQGFEITSIAGTSMGSLVGAVYALGKLPEFKKWMCSLDKLKVFKLIDFTFSSQGLIKGDRVLNTIKQFVGDCNIEDLPIPYAANATDILNNKEVVFTKGDVFDAIRASIAIPLVITPVKTKNGLLGDGGVINNVPVSNVKRTPDDILVVVDVNATVPLVKLSETKKQTDKNKSVYLNKLKEFQKHLHEINPLPRDEKMGYFNLLDHTIHLMIHRMSQMIMEQHKPDILINLSKDTCGTFDFYRADELIKIGQLLCEQAIENFKTNVKQVG